MSSLFCCSDARPYKSTSTSHESKFRAFTTWASFPKSSNIATPAPSAPSTAALFVVQLVRQVNYGPLESKRYFVSNADTSDAFVEVTEQWLVENNLQKLNSYKNYRCTEHNRFFEVNVYQKDPVNAHHWRANIARPATEIDL